MTGGVGLRRFVGTPEQALAPVREQPSAEKCEMCGTEVGARHGHVVDIEHRSLMCACRACFLLFTRPDAAGGRYRAVPERVLHDPTRPLSPAAWTGLGVPVNSAFFLRGDSGLAAFYPSPAGATECLLDLAAWARLGEQHPLLAEAQPEVEAILVREVDGAVETYLVPIDSCYQLVGTVRLYWKGFDGGQEAHEHIDEFFADLRARARPLYPEE
ncbi:hypothetical protein F0L68_10245 [Solihabitans fulvus]|uniref:Uncharacterized protein n=1 Tax=Solihabitans fulvus TaxID=1892852 RepID=A0A5B2XKW2_9PSEU|nr:DUF5947 family protein [Solihabitans fulvus]KAA2263402.1 hypothetical protein F0L68_10245 [Solihabitans fulvus]